MTATKREFERFVHWLQQHETSCDVRRLTNGIRAHFDAIAATNTARGERARAIVRLLRDGFANLDDVLPTAAELPRAADISWTRLERLNVGPFRGFIQPEPLDLNRRVVLVYGPNGTGKSSLCEALEFALTGTVSEASAKRIDDATYCTNAHVQAFSAPTLIASDPQGAQYVVAQNPDAYRFCIIEKNRIEEFSRISARTPREQARSIAALFGIDHFDQFVGNFNDSIDPYLDLVGRKTEALEKARSAIQADIALVESAPQRREQWNEAEAALAAEFAPDFTFARLCEWIGDEATPGRLAEVILQFEEPSPQAINLLPGTEGVGMLRTNLDGEIARLTTLSRQLEERQRDVSYKQIYEAVSNVQDYSPDRCPACDTPIAQASSNPYEKARRVLQTLGELAQLESEHAESRMAVARNWRALSNTLRSTVALARERIEIDALVEQRIQQIPLEPDIGFWESLATLHIGETPFWTYFDDFLARIAAHNDHARKEREQRDALRTERARLQSFHDRVLAHRNARRDFEASVTAASERIREFETRNAELIAAAKAEAPEIALNLGFKTAYDFFLEKLRQYRDDLPRTLLAGLNNTARDLYNSFNRDDHESDKLAALRLPTRPDEPLAIAYAAEPEKSLDALHVLSEGHIRCLGLSILVAKFVQEGCRVMIFDDAVNAIDDDHRNGICKTIFEDGWLRDKQIILTCHGEEFIKSIQRDLGAEATQRDSLLYVFAPHRGDRRLNIDTRPRTRNYVLVARESLDRMEIREALSQSRRALEGIVDRLWRWLSKRGRGELRLLIRRHGAHAELRDLTEALNRDLKTQQFEHERKQPLTQALDRLLGINPGSLEWTYLNAGTHEADRVEFDRAVVRTVVEAIEELDRTLTRP